MKRSKPLLRTAMKPRGEIKPKACDFCGDDFFPARPMQVVCSPACASKKVRRQKKDEAANHRAAKEAIKSISTLEGECRKIVQKIARLRDKDDGCISCHMGPNYDGQWHGSHYRAHGGCSSLQLHLWNIHKACAQCNLFKGGNKEGFIAGLLAKPGYGRERLEWLDSQPKSKRFEREYLLRFKAVMGRRMRRMEKWHG